MQSILFAYLTVHIVGFSLHELSPSSHIVGRKLRAQKRKLLTIIGKNFKFENSPPTNKVLSELNNRGYYINPRYSDNRDKKNHFCNKKLKAAYIQKIQFVCTMGTISIQNWHDFSRKVLGIFISDVSRKFVLQFTIYIMRFFCGINN